MRLEYMGRPLRTEPLDTSLEDVRTQFQRGEPVALALEPGDATRYGLLLVSADAPYVATALGAYGIPTSQAHRYALVVRLNDHECPGVWVSVGRIRPGDIRPLSNNNAWTAEFLAWWLTGLFTEDFDLEEAAL